ncbi:glycine-rich domain-containing protein [Mycolicibacterium conceptionense]|uniref:glycine-rich domain-containing protein n=1 Tax=Mycolicibacterium conceptionense TaxID=451644 RepID=UPI0002D63880|nr:hypothetical protein [Mycolicibacterium conceptionense]
MTDPLPEWARATPNLESLHNLPDIPWGGYNPKDVSLPSLPDLFEFVGKFLEKFLGQVVLALVGTLFPGVSSFEQLQEWAQNLGSQIVNFIYTTSGINLASWDDFVESLADGKGIDLPWLKTGLDALSDLFGGIDFTDPPTPEEVWSAVVSTFINPLINVVEAVANALLTAPLNAANLFGRIALPQFGSGVPIMSLTTAVPNELEPFTATSVPTSDGWSYNAAEDAAQVICDGSLKTLYLRSGVIKVEEGQPLDTSIEVKYSGITSGAGQTIRYVLETFTTDNGSGTPTPVIVGAVTNPSGTITTSVTLGDASWDIPTGVKSVRPALVADESITAGTVYWKNIPELYKKLDPVFAGGLPAVLNNLGDWIETLVDQLLGALGLPALGSLFDKIMDLGDEIEGWFDDTLNTASDLAGLIGDLLSNPAAVLGNLPRTLVSGLEAWWDGITAKTVNLTSGGFFDAGKLANITGTISQSLVTGLTSSLNTLNTFIQNVIDAILTALRGVPIIGGVIADIITDVTGLKETADNALSTADQIVEDANAGWTGSTPSGTPTQVYDTITQIKDAVSGTYTIEVKTTSGTWTNPGGITEFWAICIGSGGGGNGGPYENSVPGAGSAVDIPGGAGGKYLAQQINPADLGSTVSYVVPAGGIGGEATSAGGSLSGVPGTPGSPATLGSLASSSNTLANGAIASLLGYYGADVSAAGSGGSGGGRGGSSSGTTSKSGVAGTSTPLAAGGARGERSNDSPYTVAGHGSPGGAASLTGQTRCGGAGGGGGGGGADSGVDCGRAGNGGAGGFPGGGGGGGGGGYVASGRGGGIGGNGANGAIILLYR